MFSKVAISAAVLAVAPQVLALTVRAPFTGLVPRQIEACTAQCGPIQSTIDTCTTPDCLCTPAVATSLQTCISCVAQSADPDDIAAAQSIASSYNAGCPGGGVTVPAPGPSSSVTGSSSVPSSLTSSRPATTSSTPPPTTRTTPSTTPTPTSTRPPTTTTPVVGGGSTGASGASTGGSSTSTSTPSGSGALSIAPVGLVGGVVGLALMMGALLAL